MLPEKSLSQVLKPLIAYRLRKLTTRVYRNQFLVESKFVWPLSAAISGLHKFVSQAYSLSVADIDDAEARGTSQGTSTAIMTTASNAVAPQNNNTRHKSSVALILIDVINHFDFPDGEKIPKNALPMAGRLAKLKQRCRRAGIPAIDVNDKFGQWRSEAKSLVSTCMASAQSRKNGRPCRGLSRDRVAIDGP